MGWTEPVEETVPLLALPPPELLVGAAVEEARVVCSAVVVCCSAAVVEAGALVEEAGALVEEEEPLVEVGAAVVEEESLLSSLLSPRETLMLCQEPLWSP